MDGKKSKCLNPPSALEFFIDKLPLLVPDVDICFSVLLHLLPEASEACKTSTNLLFDEDPLNDYAEELLVMKHVTRALETGVTHLLSREDLEHESLAKYCKSLTSKIPAGALEEADNRASWDNPHDYLRREQARLLEPLLNYLVRQK